MICEFKQCKSYDVSAIEQAYSQVSLEAIGCEIVHFLEPRGRINTWLLFVKIDGHRISERFKKAGVM